jgi:hypothetical protein
MLAPALALAQPAAPIDLPDSPAELRLDPAWQAIAVPPGTAEPPVAAWRHPTGAVLVVTRAAAPNPDAWRVKSRPAYADEVEAGTRAAAAGYRRRARSMHDVRGVPALDLSFRRGHGASAEVVSMRFLFFRTHTMTAAVAVPDARWRKAQRTAEAAVTGLGLPEGYVP